MPQNRVLTTLPPVAPGLEEAALWQRCGEGPLLAVKLIGAGTHKYVMNTFNTV